MKRTNILFSLLVICLMAGSIYSQPKLTINVVGGYSAPLQDFKLYDFTGDIMKDTVPENFPYKMKTGFSFGVDGKLAIGKKGNFRVVFGAMYNMFSNSGTINDSAAGTYTLKLKMHVLTISLGGEWAFMPSKHKINPFVGLDITGNFFGGTITPQTNGVDTYKSETRIGIQPGAGIDFVLSKQVGAVLGVKYHLMNLIGAGADDPSQVAPNEVDLGDKPHTLADGTTSTSKHLSYFQVYAGVSFYFGAPKTSTMKK